MGKKKGPPAGLPKTRAELEHIKTEANNEGAAHALEILLYVLVDKFGWETDELIRLMNSVASQAQAVSTGYATIHDIRKVLREEYQIEV